MTNPYTEHEADLLICQELARKFNVISAGYVTVEEGMIAHCGVMAQSVLDILDVDNPNTYIDLWTQLTESLVAFSLRLADLTYQKVKGDIDP